MENTNDKPVDKLRILVVDDSDFTRKSIVEILESAGHVIAGEAADAEGALRIGQNTTFDLLLVDVVMPKASGIDLVKAINEQKTRCKVIMMSSLDMENVVIEAIAIGAVDFLRKPFEKRELLWAVEKVKGQLIKDVTSA